MFENIKTEEEFSIMNTKSESLRLTGKIFATGVMSFCGVVSETAMNVTFPTLMNEFNIGTSTVQWVTTGYLVVLALVITMSSYLKRNCSSRTLFLTAISCFIIATIGCSIAPEFSVLLIGRMIQGVGTGIALPLMFNIILSEAQKEKIGTFMGIGMLITAVAPAVGPVLGGFIVDYLGWRYIFVSLMPLLLLALAIGWILIKYVAPTDHSCFHFFDYLLIIIGYSTFIFAMVQASSEGWLSIEVISLLIVAIVSLTGFILVSRKEEHPLLCVDVLHFGKFMLALSAILIAQFTVLALGYLIPNYSQITNHTTAFIAGGLLVPGCIIGAILSPISGRLLDKFGARLPILSGFGIMTFSLLLFAWHGAEMTTNMFYVFYFIFTIGQGLGCGSVMTFGLSQLPKNLSADGNALLNSFQQLAGAMGTAVVSTIVAAEQQSNIHDFSIATADGSHHAFILLAIMIMIAFVATLIMTKARRQP